SQPELDAVRVIAEQSTVTKAVATVADLSTIATPAAGDSARVTNDPLGDVTDGNGVWSWDGSDWTWIGPWVDPVVTAQINAWRGKINGWPDPYFRTLPLQTGTFNGRRAWWDSGIPASWSSISLVDQSAYQGRALRKV